jgi:hypothetical protein
MDADHRHPTHRAAIERQAHVLRTIGDYRRFAAGRLAAEERQRAWMAEGEQARLLRTTGPRPTDRVAAFARVRDAVGSALIRAGGRLRGGTDPARGPEVAPGA